MEKVKIYPTYVVVVYVRTCLKCVHSKQILHILVLKMSIAHGFGPDLRATTIYVLHL